MDANKVLRDRDMAATENVMGSWPYNSATFGLLKSEKNE